MKSKGLPQFLSAIEYWIPWNTTKRITAFVIEFIAVFERYSSKSMKHSFNEITVNYSNQKYLKNNGLKSRFRSLTNDLFNNKNQTMK